MRIVTWTIRLAAFLLLLAFAAKNADPVTLRLFFDLSWQLPLVALLLAFFAAGVLFGLAAMLGPLLRQRRELGRLRREDLAAAAVAAPVPTQPPAAES
ncbi:MAG: LapA family protein [Betaproteobacteria bacterium]|nr:MAG: LapA family protein [Betaproteobacteria bacterium]